MLHSLIYERFSRRIRTWRDGLTTILLTKTKKKKNLTAIIFQSFADRTVHSRRYGFNARAHAVINRIVINSLLVGKETTMDSVLSISDRVRGGLNAVSNNNWFRNNIVIFLIKLITLRNRSEKKAVLKLYIWYESCLMTIISLLWTARLRASHTFSNFALSHYKYVMIT